MSEKYDVFISYAQEDRPWVSQLVDALSAQALRVWYDEAEIQLGDQWRDRIEEGLRESAYVVMVITPATAHSTWLAAQMGATLALHKPLIPIVAEDTRSEDIPGPIRLRKYLRRNDPKAVAEEIAHRIASERNSEDKPVLSPA